MERRDKSRLDLRLSCRVVTGDLLSENSGDTTENISRNGLLLRWTRQTPVPDAGSSIRVEVALPSDGLVAPRMIRCESTVVRVIPAQDGQAHVALRVNSMCFVDDPARTWVPPASPIQELVN